MSAHFFFFNLFLIAAESQITGKLNLTHKVTLLDKVPLKTLEKQQHSVKNF